MKKIILSFFAVMAFYGQANACSAEAIKEAEANLASAKRNFEQGTSTITDSREALVQLIEMRRCVEQEKAKKSLCKEYVDALQASYDAQKLGYQVGVRIMTDVLATQAKLAQAKVNCN